MRGDWFELAIIAVIIIGIGYTIWKGGAANPESTGSLGRRLAKIDAEVRALKAGETRLATKDDLKLVHIRLSEQERGQEETRRALSALDRDITELRESASARHATLQHVCQQVDRLYDHIVNKGMNS